jgi:hypothetical protein
VSTYWYFVCLDHEPQLSSADEFTQHTDDVDYANAMALAMARPLDESWWEGDQGGHLGYMERNARRFLQQHPSCRLEAVSEYGDHRDVPAARTSTADAAEHGPQERPPRNTLDDRLRALSDLLTIPGARIDDLNRRTARTVIDEARTELHRHTTHPAALAEGDPS